MRCPPEYISRSHALVFAIAYPSERAHGKSVSWYTVHAAFFRTLYCATVGRGVYFASIFVENIAVLD